MNPILNMQQHKEQFTQNDLIIYQAILDHPDQVVYRSTNKLAEDLGVSQPALTRFIKVLGYQKYQDFRADITAWLATQNAPTDDRRLPYFTRLEQVLAEAEQILTDSYMKELADYVLSFSRIFATGIEKSYHPAALMQTLSRKHSIFVHSCRQDAANDCADHMTESDLMIVFSLSAKKETMEQVCDTKGKIMLVTTNAYHNYRDTVDRTVVLPYLPPDPENSSVAPVLFDIFVELLDKYIAKKLNRKE